MPTSYTIPPAPSVPFLDGVPNPVSLPWYAFLRGIFETTGSGQAPISLGDMLTAFAAQRLSLAVPNWLRVIGSPVGGNEGINGKLTVQSATIPHNMVLASPNLAQGPILARALVGPDLPLPAATTLGGVKSLAAVAHNFVTSIVAATGQPVAAQPAFSDISGSIAGSQSAVGVAATSGAHTGYPGEFVSASIVPGAAVALTTATPANVTSIALTAGDWDVYGSIYFYPDVTTVIASEFGGIATLSATLLTAPFGGVASVQGVTLAAGMAPSLTLGYVRVSIAAPTTVYLVAQASFTVSTCNAYGIIQARRSANVY